MAAAAVYPATLDTTLGAVSELVGSVEETLARLSSRDALAQIEACMALQAMLLQATRMVSGAQTKAMQGLCDPAGLTTPPPAVTTNQEMMTDAGVIELPPMLERPYRLLRNFGPAVMVLYDPGSAVAKMQQAALDAVAAELAPRGIRFYRTSGLGLVRPLLLPQLLLNFDCYGRLGGALRELYGFHDAAKLRALFTTTHGPPIGRKATDVYIDTLLGADWRTRALPLPLEKTLAYPWEFGLHDGWVQQVVKGYSDEGAYCVDENSDLTVVLGKVGALASRRVAASAVAEQGDGLVRRVLSATEPAYVQGRKYVSICHGGGESALSPPVLYFGTYVGDDAAAPFVNMFMMHCKIHGSGPVADTCVFHTSYGPLPCVDDVYEVVPSMRELCNAACGACEPK